MPTSRGCADSWRRGPSRAVASALRGLRGGGVRVWQITSGSRSATWGETVPGRSRVGVVWDDRIGAPQWTETRSAARASNLSVQAVTLHDVAQTDDVMKRLLVERPQALLFLTAPVVLHALPRLTALAIQHRLPSISPFSTYPESGGLMACGPDFPEMYRQWSSYVDRISPGHQCWGSGEASCGGLVAGREAAASGAPQPSQNRLPGSTVAPQLGQALLKVAPHSRQNRASSRFSARHRGHCTRGTSPWKPGRFAPPDERAEISLGLL